MAHTEQDRSLAARILDELFRTDDDYIGFELSEDIEEFQYGLSIVDVEQDAISFLNELSLLDDVKRHTDSDVTFPALTIKDQLTIPVSLSYLGFPKSWSRSTYRYWRHNPFWHELVYNLVHDLKPGWPENLSRYFRLTSLKLEEARESFVHNATNFLADRIATVRTFASVEGNLHDVVRSPRLPSNTGATPKPALGCRFTVTTDTSSLRVFWSGAYYISPSFFGAPTSPATGVLQSGTYVFGVDGGPYGGSIQWDTNAVCTLPGAPQVHLNY